MKVGKCVCGARRACLDSSVELEGQVRTACDLQAELRGTTERENDVPP